jgi:DNA-binding NtrC family response regulator
VLVIPSDAVIGALMGELIRFAGYHPVFLKGDEAVVGAVERMRPTLLFIDSDHPAAKSTDVRQAVRAMDAHVVLFSGSRTERELTQIARQRGDGSFPLPNGPRALGRLIDRMLRDDCSSLDGGPRPAPPLRS